ncbi:replication endonuclease [Citrobacter enshiensis]|uniref:replication endonuclease n=1 Tax=Citrobacter enshiensis TaxID=2971264 RepID=UPI0023E88355|nr:replication endonuclease [Citrobacter enshiensis]WET39888.1 replication endonuclease [Citrobacter enshiensis]
MHSSQSTPTDMESLKLVSFYLQHKHPPGEWKSTALNLKQDALSDRLSRVLTHLYTLKKHPFLPLINLSDYDVSHLAERCASPTDKNPNSSIVMVKELILEQVSENKRYSPRLYSPLWWETRLRKEINRLKEKLLISLGLVQKRISAYISRDMYASGQQKINDRIHFLSNRCVLNAESQKDIATLFQMAMSGIANPRVQKSELAQILFGTYKYSIQCNHISRLFTITLPSSYHSTKIDGTPCDNWNGLSPKESQAKLEERWKKARAALSEVSVYGTRIVEPHHDATPHWHIIVYMPRDYDEKVISVFEKYFSDESDSLSENRMLSHEIVRNEAALHYLMKYMVSSIPGLADEKAICDSTGDLYSRIAIRVKIWASLWGIRRFQHFGLPEIGVWRECRRIRSTNITHDLGQKAEAVRHAADHSDFAKYIEMQGGAGIKRSGRTLQVAREKSPFENIWGENKIICIGIKTAASNGFKIYRTRSVYFAQQPVSYPGHSLFSSIPCNIVNNCRIPTILSFSPTEEFEAKVTQWGNW